MRLDRPLISALALLSLSFACGDTTSDDSDGGAIDAAVPHDLGEGDAPAPSTDAEAKDAVTEDAVEPTADGDAPGPACDDKCVTSKIKQQVSRL